MLLLLCQFKTELESKLQLQIYNIQKPMSSVSAFFIVNCIDLSIKYQELLSFVKTDYICLFLINITH